MLRIWQSVKRGEREGITWLIGGAAALIFIFFAVSSHRARAAIDPLVGAEKWAIGVPRETSLGVYRVWESADFKGGDIAFSGSKSIDECLYFCDEHPECIYVALWNGFCYLKDTPTRFETFKNRAGLLSAKRVEIKPVKSKDFDDSESQATQSSTYRVWNDTAYEGVQGKETLQTSFDGCLRFCDDDTECIHITFDGRRCRSHKESGSKLKKVKAQGSTAAMKSRMLTAPDPLVKHHWTKGGEQQTEFAVYQTWQECQFKGADIVAVTANSLAECLMECDAELFCRHVTLVGKECMLKGWAPEFFEIVPGRSDVWAAKQIESKIKESKYTVFQSGVSFNDEDLGDLHHDLLVGEHYDESSAHETKFNRYRLWEGFDFLGGDIHTDSLNLPAITIETCLDQCDHKPDCAYAVVILGKECWLKSRPIQLSRTIDSRSDIYAAMKLGRVGKKGIDAVTTHRRDRRAVLDSESGYFTSGGSGSLLWILLFGGGLVWAFAYGVSYWNQVRGGRYADELA